MDLAYYLKDFSTGNEQLTVDYLIVEKRRGKTDFHYLEEDNLSFIVVVEIN